MRQIPVGATSRSIDVFLQDSSSNVGAGLAGLAYNTSGLTCYYRKGQTGTSTQLALATQTVGGAYSSGGFIQIDATYQPGKYRLDLANTMLDTVGELNLTIAGAANLAVYAETIQIVSAAPDANVAQIAGVAAAATRLSLSANVIIPGTVDSTGFTPTTTEFEASDVTTAAAQHYNGRIIIFTSGTLIGQATSISDYLLSSGRGHFTVPALTSAPANGVTFVIV